MAFHHQNGFCFERRPDGSVRIFKLRAGDNFVEWEHVLDGDSWCSAIASVSAKGGDGETFNAARELHQTPRQA